MGAEGQAPFYVSEGVRPHRSGMFDIAYYIALGQGGLWRYRFGRNSNVTPKGAVSLIRHS